MCTHVCVYPWVLARADLTTPLLLQTTEDLEANFDDLLQLALEEKRAKENSASPASPAKKPMSRNASAQALKELAAAPATVAGAAEVCLHVLVLGEYKPLDADTKRGLPHKSFRRSYAYAVMDEMSTARMYQKLVSAKASFLRSNSVESVTVMLPHSAVSDNLNYVSIYNFAAAEAYDEHRITRHILPPEATMLELGRLSNFNVERCWFPDAPHTHVYFGVAKQQPLDTRLFVRALHSRAPALTPLEARESLASLCTSELAVTLATLEQVNKGEGYTYIHIAPRESRRARERARPPSPRVALVPSSRTQDFPVRGLTLSPPHPLCTSELAVTLATLEQVSSALKTPKTVCGSWGL